MNLGPTRGTWFYSPTLLVKGNRLRELLLHIAGEWSRSDQIHVSYENVIELRKLIQSAPTKPMSQARKAPVMLFGRRRFSIGIAFMYHRSELVKSEFLPI